MSKKPFLLYHWSASTNRASILKTGLRPALNVVCLCNSPSYAWALSAPFSPQVKQWDLWMVWSTSTRGLILKRFNHLPHAQEFRTPNAIRAKDIWMVGSRKQDKQ